MSMKNLMKLAAGALFFSALCFPAFASETPSEEIHWGYFGQSHVLPPDHWGDEYPDCNLNSQSPINIETSKVEEVALDLEVDYNGDLVQYSNNGHSVVVSGTRTLTTPDGGEYQLVQFHFHTLSENTVNGQHYDMEMHLVHADAAGHLAVLGVFITEGEKNKVLANVFEHLPHHAEGEEAEALLADLVDNYEGLLPENRSFFSFEGSLTTPPCSEEVKWFVFENPIEMAADQIAAFRELFQEEGNLYDTNRPVQPLNTRTVGYTAAD